MCENVEIIKTTKEDIHNLIQYYYESIIAPLDDMWEKGIIGVSNYYKLEMERDKVGYFCLDSNNVLLQYFIKDNFLYKAKALLKYILEYYNIKKGFVSTIDIRSLPLFLDFNTQITTHTLLFMDLHYVDGINSIQDLIIRKADTCDLQKVIEYYNNVDIKEVCLEPYYIDIIKKQELFLFILNNEIIGTGEHRSSEIQRKYVNLGVTVSRVHRRKGLASFILSYLKEYSYEQELVPICSTTIENIGSQKAIINSGFYPYHRILEVNF